MKKIVCAMMVALMMTGMVASAELTYKCDKIERFKLGVDHNGKDAYENVYYLIATSESGASTRIEVTQAEYEKQEKLDKKANDQRSWLAKAGSVITFWNPND